MPYTLAEAAQPEDATTDRDLPARKFGARCVVTGCVGVTYSRVSRRRRVPEMATRLSAGMAVSLEASLTERVSHSRLSKLFSGSLLIFVGLLSSSQLALGQFTQQGSKLVGTGAVGNAQQGVSVALSSDGNTAIVGGPDDNPGAGTNSGAGAAWVFTRSASGVWSQQGNKLVGIGAVRTARQGFSVALSADGNTAIVGGISDHMLSGAAWVFTRSGAVWTQEHLGH